jgi:hypothetical protein
MNPIDMRSIRIGNIQGEFASEHPHGEVIPAAQRLRFSALF